MSPDDPADEPPNASTGFFRCPVTEEMSGATIRCGRRGLPAGVQETSIDGFTVLVGPAAAKRLKVGRTWTLEHQGAVTEVHPQWFFNSPEGEVQIGLRRLRDITPVEGRTRVGRGPSLHRCDGGNHLLTYVGGLLAAFCFLALPGPGDYLGTATPIQNVLSTVTFEVVSAFE